MIAAFLSGALGWFCFHACSDVHQIPFLTFVGQRFLFPHWFLARGQSLLPESTLTIPSHNFHVTSPSSKSGYNACELVSYFTVLWHFLFSSVFCSSLITDEKSSPIGTDLLRVLRIPPYLELYTLLNFPKSSLLHSNMFTESREYGPNIFGGHSTHKRCNHDNKRKHVLANSLEGLENMNFWAVQWWWCKGKLGWSGRHRAR